MKKYPKLANKVLMVFVIYIFAAGTISVLAQSTDSSVDAGIDAAIDAGVVTVPTVGTWIMAVPDNNPARLPTTCLSGDPCKAKIIRVIRQTANPMRWDMWLRTLNSGDHHNHIVRLHIGNYWVWLGHGSLMWPRAMKQYAADNPDKNIVGPYPLRDLASYPAFCNQVASSVLVNVTSDAGTLSPGTYPDGGVASCAGAYWLLRARFGGPWSVSWTASQLDSTLGSKYKYLVKPRIATGVWDAPPVRTHRQCSVPVGTPCP